MLYNFTKKITRQRYAIAGFFIFGVISGVSIDKVLFTKDDYIPKNIDNISSSGNALESASVKKATSDFGSFWKTWSILEDNFAAKSTSTVITQNDKIDGAIVGLANSYKDPYTTVFVKENAENFKESVSGKFEGIGAVMAEVESKIIVQLLIKDSPAQKVGLLPGDLVISVDGVSTNGQNMVEVINKIRGKSGTDVVLKISRNGSGVKDYKITRGAIVIPSVASATAENIASAVKDTAKKIVANVKSAFESDTSKISKMDEKTKAEIKNINDSADKITDNLHIMKLGIFSGTSGDQIKNELTLFEKSGKKNLIIDLRGNPGGLIDIAQEFASYFLPKDGLIVSEVEGKTGNRRNFVSRGYGVIKNVKDKKIIILVDRNSASASEIFGAALKENNLATLIGEKTFGKGSVQNMVDINDHITLKVTIARWYTPLGNTIDGEGIMPNIVVPQGTSTTDVVMERAVQYLIEGK